MHEIEAANDNLNQTEPQLPQVPCDHVFLGQIEATPLATNVLLFNEKKRHVRSFIGIESRGTKNICAV